MAHWRDTYKPARFFMLDARAGVPIILCALHIRPWTIGIALLVVILFWVLERRGLSFQSAFRAFRAELAGNHRPALGTTKIRGHVDYSRRPFN